MPTLTDHQSALLRDAVAIMLKAAQGEDYDEAIRAVVRNYSEPMIRQTADALAGHGGSR